MSNDASLLFAILAYRAGYVTDDQLQGAVTGWLMNPGADLRRMLIDTGRLTQEQADAIQRSATAIQASGTPVLPPSTDHSHPQTLVLPNPEPGVLHGEVASAGRYDPGKELGRGGIGRVIEALDRVLGRTVALKLLYEAGGSELSERFRWEARITGRLEHPNIVPVHDVGVLPGTGEQFMAMKRIAGRDLGKVIADGEWPLRRMVEALRDACRAVAYAHSRGVIHRDLKPANIMVGDFGEVLVVDWGLARMMGEEDRVVTQFRHSTRKFKKAPAPIARPEETSRMTMDGDVLGTPSYMPPEQAMGWLQKIDERSDVFSLGATLYEILAGRPPYIGDSNREIIDLAVTGETRPPSQFRKCPPELELVCRTAIARNPVARFQSVAALEKTLDAWLEGTLERERREGMGREALAEAKAGLEQWRHALAKVEQAQAERRKDDVAQGLMTRDRNMKLWKLDDLETAANTEAAEAFAGASAALDTALSLKPGDPDARRLKAEMYWEQFVIAERAENPEGREVARHLAQAFNDGSLDARLQGDGTLELRTRSWDCPCLVHGRSIEPADFFHGGWRPWSGDRLDGVATTGAAELAPTESLRLKVHGPACEPVPLDGADVWAFRFEEVERLLIPRSAAGAGSGRPIPGSILDEMYGASPYRPIGPGIYLGKTPIARRPWPMGSHLLIAVAPGRRPQRIPFEVLRNQDVVLDATLYRPEEIPAGHDVVLGGRFISRREAGTAPVLEEKVLEDVFLSRFPVTCAEWANWLNERAKRMPEDAKARRPRRSPDDGYLWPWASAGTVIPTKEWRERADESERSLYPRVATTSGEWHPRWPVLGISWVDGQVYCRDRSLETGWLFTAPDMFVWERAARGGDRRRFPTGDFMWSELSNTNRTFPGGQSPAEIDTFPHDETPWGIRGLMGNASCWCLNDPGSSYRNWRAIRGGSWARIEIYARTSYHQGGEPLSVRVELGLRTMAVVRVGRKL